MSAARRDVAPAALAAVARGQGSLARALGVPGEALAAARHLAWTALEAGRDDIARVLLEGCVALDEADRWSARALGELLLRTGQVQAALEVSHRAASAARAAGATDAGACLVAARALIASGRTSDAVGWLRAAHGDPTASRAVQRVAHAVADRIDGGNGPR